MSTDRSAGAALWPGPLAISALGAATCFGGMTTAAAAARAGLSRARDLPDLTYVDDKSKESTPASGSPIVGVTDGFEGAGRLGRMSALAVEELTSAADWVHPRRLQCFLALPAMAEDEARLVGQSLARALGAPADLVHVHALGHRGTGRALREAAEALRAGRCDHAVVGACDSWVDAVRLQQIADLGRLKTLNHPVGFTPGEAAVFLLLERPGAAGGGRRSPDALLTDVREEIEENNHAADKPLTGRALARLLLAALGQGDRGTLYLDLNGEEFRATDWGMALVRAQSARALDGWAREMPAASFGDTGVASSILAAALATRAFARGYAVGDRALVIASGEGPERLALVIERPRAAAAARGARG
ncbi:hypothetical protein [Sorangium sp. So ce542]|uniref:hypothetical protein n=1 Tax=Sorangium sp. So ce542 TaxID=3133316 RepID=UPI003F648853